MFQVSVSQAPSQRRSLIEVGRQQPIIPENSRLAVPMSGTDKCLSIEMKINREGEEIGL